MEIIDIAAKIVASYISGTKNPGAITGDEGDIHDKERLYKAIRSKFLSDKDEHALNSLRQMEEQPESEEFRRSLAEILARKAKVDLQFARELSQLVKAVTKTKGLVRVSAEQGHKSGLVRAGGHNSTAARTMGLEATRNMTAFSGQGAKPSAYPGKIMRYPHLECPDKAAIGQRFSIFVRLLLKSPEADAQAVAIEDAGLPEELPQVEAVISAHGFEIEGSNTRIMFVDRDGDCEERFVLIPRQEGDLVIRSDLYQHGRRIGTLRHNVMVNSGFTDVVAKPSEPPASLEIRSSPGAPPPDLELYVELDRRDGTALHFRLHSTKESVGYNHARFGQVTLQDSPLGKMKSLYQEFSLMAAQSRADTGRRMAAIGNNLWDDLIPDELKREYWIFKKEVKSLLITSDEPWIPWEVMKPYRYNDQNEREDDPFWCQQFSMARWLSGPGAVDRLAVGPATPVACNHIDLASVREEVAFISQLDKLEPGITGQAPSKDKTEVLELMETKEFSILHFASHGKFNADLPDDSAVMLSDGPLRPSDIQTRFGGRRQRPLIFINACEGAQMGFSFTGLGGWADRLVNSARVGAFAGAMWEVNDEMALQFAIHFYTALLRDKQTIAQAFRMAREEIRKAKPANSTWLAYALYADPEGRIGQ